MLHDTSSIVVAVPPGAGQYNIQTSAWLDKTSNTGTTDPTAVPLGIGYDLGHKHKSFLTLCDLNGNGAIEAPTPDSTTDE